MLVGTAGVLEVVRLADDLVVAVVVVVVVVVAAAVAVAVAAAAAAAAAVAAAAVVVAAAAAAAAVGGGVADFLLRSPLGLQLRVHEGLLFSTGPGSGKRTCRLLSLRIHKSRRQVGSSQLVLTREFVQDRSDPTEVSSQRWILEVRHQDLVPFFIVDHSN